MIRKQVSDKDCKTKTLRQGLFLNILSVFGLESLAIFFHHISTFLGCTCLKAYCLLILLLYHSCFCLLYWCFQSKIVRVLNLWQKNAVFKSDIIQPLLDMAAGIPPPSVTPVMPSSAAPVNNTTPGQSEYTQVK